MHVCKNQLYIANNVCARVCVFVCEMEKVKVYKNDYDVVYV